MKTNTRNHVRAQYHKKLKAVTAELSQAQEQLQHDQKNTRGEEKQGKDENKKINEEISSGGSVLVEKRFEPLEAILKAYEARIENHQTKENRWMTYPNAEIELQRLEMCKKMIETAQALMVEQLPSIPIHERQ